MAKFITDMETWLLDYGDRIYRYLVYRKMFTPYECEQKYCDETEYENGGHYTLCFIEEAIDLGNSNWMLGMRDIYDGELSDTIKYVRLDEIRLEYFECDQDLFTRDCEEDCDDEL